MASTTVAHSIMRRLDEEYDWKIISVLPHFSGIASVIGSSVIIITILTSCRRRANPYHRLMLGLSFYDVVMSFFMFMGVWAHPTSSCWDETDCDNKGSVLSCDFFGFFYQLAAIAIPLYNVALSLYIARSTGTRFAKNPSSYRNIDLPFHAGIGIFAFIQALIPVFLLDYNPYVWLCMVTPVGWEDGDYVRGSLETMRIYAYLNLIVVVVSTAFVTAAMIYTFFSVLRNTEYKSQNRNAGMKVAGVGLLYTIPFYITWIIPSVFFFIFLEDWYNSSNELTQFERYFGLVWISTFLPLQGFFNLFVYFVPICLNVVGTEQEYTPADQESQTDISKLQNSEEEAEAPADESTMFKAIYDQMC